MKLLFLFFSVFAIFCTACLSSDDNDSNEVTNTIDTSDANVGDAHDTSDLNSTSDGLSDASDIIDPGTPCKYPEHNACGRGFICSESGFCTIMACIAAIPSQCPNGAGCILSSGRCTSAGECSHDEDTESCIAAGYSFGVTCGERVCQERF